MIKMSENNPEDELMNRFTSDAANENREKLKDLVEEGHFEFALLSFHGEIFKELLGVNKKLNKLNRLLKDVELQNMFDQLDEGD